MKIKLQYFQILVLLLLALVLSNNIAAQNYSKIFRSLNKNKIDNVPQLIEKNGKKKNSDINVISLAYAMLYSNKTFSGFDPIKAYDYYIAFDKGGGITSAAKIIKKFNYIIPSIKYKIESSVLENAKAINTEDAYSHIIRQCYNCFYLSTAKQLREEAVLGIAMKSMKTADFDYFINNYPLSDLAIKAIKMRDSVAFFIAKSTNTIEAYKEYLNKYKDNYKASKFFSLAESIIDSLAFIDALKIGTIDGFNDYISSYGSSKFLSTAIDSRDSLALNSAIKQNTIEAFQQFIKLYPKSKFAPNATNLRDSLAFQNAMTSGFIDAFDKFILTYGGNKFVDAAKEKKDSAIYLFYKLRDKCVQLSEQILLSSITFNQIKYYYCSLSQKNLLVHLNASPFEGVNISGDERSTSITYDYMLYSSYTATESLQIYAWFSFDPDKKCLYKNTANPESKVLKYKNEFINIDCDKKLISKFDSVYKLLKYITQEMPPSDSLFFLDIRDNQIYNTINIGKQKWLSENLNSSFFRNGDIIPEAKTNKEWEKAGLEERPMCCSFLCDSANRKKWGKYYNWYAIIDPRGLAPEGWHIADYPDWRELSETIQIENKLHGGDTLGALVKYPYMPDLYSSKITSNYSGFSGLYCGGISYDGSISCPDQSCGWWSSQNINEKKAWYIYTNGYKIEYSPTDKSWGFPVRCVKD